MNQSLCWVACSCRLLSVGFRPTTFKVTFQLPVNTWAGFLGMTYSLLRSEKKKSKGQHLVRAPPYDAQHQRTISRDHPPLSQPWAAQPQGELEKIQMTKSKCGWSSPANRFPSLWSKFPSPRLPSPCQWVQPSPKTTCKQINFLFSILLLILSYLIWLVSKKL